MSIKEVTAPIALSFIAELIQHQQDSEYSSESNYSNDFSEQMVPTEKAAKLTYEKVYANFAL